MDLSKLRDICATDDGVDEVLMAQLLGMFLTDNRQRVDELGAAAAAGDVERVHRLSHTIAGSAAAAGATGLGALAQVIEAAARSRKLPQRDTLGALRAEFVRVEAVVLTRYPALGPLA